MCTVWIYIFIQKQSIMVVLTASIGEVLQFFKSSVFVFELVI